MKRRTKGKFVVLLTALLVILCCNSAFASPSSQAAVSTEYQTNSPASIELYQHLLGIIDKSQYGGMFLDSNGKLNIFAKDDMSSNSIKSLVVDQSIANTQVVYHIAKYSYQQLENVCNVLKGSMQELGIDSFYIDEKNNSVVVDIVGLTDEKRQAVLNIITSDKECIKFTKFSSPTKATTNILCGEGIVDSTKSLAYSLCCGAKWVKSGTTYYGYLTCGHNNAVNDIWTYSGSRLGTEAKRQFSGSVDAALITRSSPPFVQYGSSYSFASNGGSYTSPASTYVSGGAYPVGTSVTMFGATTGSSTGTISTTTLTVTYAGVTMTNMCQASYSTQGGDSGGPIKVAIGTSLVYTHVAGIQNAVNTNGGIYTAMDNAISALGFTGYVG